MQRISKHLTFANIVAAVAVFLAMSGAAVAGGKVAKNSVTSPSIKNGTVAGKDIKDGSLTGADIDEASLQLADETGPSGPAGGDLAGQYPNPAVGPNAIGSAEVADGTLGTSDYGNESINGSKIADGSVTVFDVADDSIPGGKIVNGSIGAQDLKNLDTVTSAGVTVNAGAPQTVTVTCVGDRKVIGGGFEWAQEEPNSIIYSAPSEADPEKSWVVRGMVDSGSNVLFAWANCMS